MKLFLSIVTASIFLFSCGGKKTTKLTFNGGELLYTDSITATQAKSLGDYLVKTNFYDGKPKTVQLDKEGGVIHFAMVLADSLANSAQYQTMGVAFVDELEQNVFDGQKVELDYCDEYMKVKKNIKGSGGTTTKKTADKETDKDADAEPVLAGNWICSNITGGDNEDNNETGDLDVLKKNFTFSFNDDATFTSDFVNQGDVNHPLKMSGYYTVVKDKISFHNLTINGQPAKDEMVFNFGLNNTQMQLISHNPEVEDLVMSFKRN